MSDDLIRYDLLVQEAMRGVVRRVLSNAARDGLPGAHYFHVEFLTSAPGVRLSDRMRERFPDRMTIILQHHFWDLEVTEEALEVGLSFGGVSERVRVPFAAVTGFFDESVQFGLRFEVEDEAGASLAADDAPAQIAPAKAAHGKTGAGKTGAGKTGAEKISEIVAEEPAKAEADKTEAPASDAEKPAGEDGSETGAKVLSLSAFRKKT